MNNFEIILILRIQIILCIIINLFNHQFLIVLLYEIILKVNFIIIGIIKKGSKKDKSTMKFR